METEAATAQRVPLSLGVYGLRALSMPGYRPVLHACVLTETPLEDLPSDQLVFSVRRGGITTRSALRAIHDPVDADYAPPLSLATVRMIEQALTLPVGKLDRLKPSAVAGREAMHMLHQFVRYMVGREFTALTFVERLTR